MHIKSNCPDLRDYYGINEMQACSDPVLFTYKLFCAAQEIAGTPHINAALSVYILKITNATEIFRFSCLGFRIFVLGFGCGFFCNIHLKF